MKIYEDLQKKRKITKDEGQLRGTDETPRDERLLDRQSYATFQALLDDSTWLSCFSQGYQFFRVQDPTRPEFKPPEHFFMDAEVVEVTAGDFLYHPAGVWHHVECTGVPRLQF